MEDVIAVKHYAEYDNNTLHSLYKLQTAGKLLTVSTESISS